MIPLLMMTVLGANVPAHLMPPEPELDRITSYWATCELGLAACEKEVLDGDWTPLDVALLAVGVVALGYAVGWSVGSWQLHHSRPDPPPEHKLRKLIFLRHNYLGYTS